MPGRPARTSSKSSRPTSGGPNFLKALRGPLPQIRLMPTGGVDLSTAESFLKAGAYCLGVGSALVDPGAIAKGDFGRIRDVAAQYAAIVRRVAVPAESPKGPRHAT